MYGRGAFAQEQAGLGGAMYGLDDGGRGGDGMGMPNSGVFYDPNLNHGQFAHALGPSMVVHGGTAAAAAAAAAAMEQPTKTSPTPSSEVMRRLEKRGHIYEYQGKQLEIRDVWKDNLEEEMNRIRAAITKYNYIAMDTEFPGVVARPIQNVQNTVDFQYQTLRCNVDLLKLIQLGIALADEDGNFAEGCPCWQFHFKFSLTDDMYAQDSIDLLVRSGIDFELHEAMGINVLNFGEALMSSGLVLMDDVRWISFHGGYDFAYLLKLLTCLPLPAEEKDFFHLLKTYFPKVYDVKHIMTKLEGATFKAGLNKLAEELEAKRVGPEHQAGSDSLLTASVFFALRKRYFNGNMQDEGNAGVLHGIGDGDPARFK
mmetsp:Transcript_8308/g.14712  ORF Transcript_8308/g.14712 Transcript_8308/m.14712 type:complete len:370 (-) Transcript_8308:25-1134(-)|eukprot:CAMPEP_0184541672 /NCGR_PEP_ID=MMETSP0199_2-20130426/1523_1 /TAXON_ID=1112570 /ORGANISM="Thraustochytrium sp., Strain LLF1b" /LENGTH=369 /DNA_ID=CAMNT_0026935409 /DNA_START=61 /DNA_END=1170 /DNA_ORIENTATION=+